MVSKLGAGVDDREAVTKVRQGEAEAFRHLVDLHQVRVYRLVREYLNDHQDAEDVTQETFVRAYRHLDRYDLERPFVPWLLTIARNLAINHIKRRRATAFEAIERFSEPADEGRGDVVETRDLAARIRETAVGLPERYRLVFHLFYRDEMPVKEIAAVLDVPEGTVKSDLFRARALIRQALKVEGVREICREL
ncbi:MAG: sigma-70 family RNA polymerase sigma factor [Planctomycetota bacterium]